MAFMSNLTTFTVKNEWQPRKMIKSLRIDSEGFFYY